jgi:seryl-tRNA synthetase
VTTVSGPKAASAADVISTHEPWSEFRRAILDAGILLVTEVDGIYGRSATYESIVEGVDTLAAAAGADIGATSLRFPPVMPWATFEKNGYLESFPDQMGSVHSFRGSEKDHAELLRRTEAHEDRGPLLEATDIVLCPAACHALYPTQSGILPEGGRTFEIVGYCFRHEPSTDPFRMQSFRMHEFVHLGTPAGRAHRDDWISRGLDMLTGLGLEVESVVANDPFFGRPGRMLAANQRSEQLKFELVTPAFAARRPTAISSSNCHLDHFSRPFDITTADGELAHTACFGFGLDRIALTLLDRYGTDPGTWPAGVRSVLWP